MVTVRPINSIPSALADLSKVEILSMSSAQDDLESEFMSFYDKEVQV
jgi:hypothetical protein